MDYKTYTEQYLSETVMIAHIIDQSEIVAAIQILSGLRKTRGRLFILGVGGSAANASHAVNDFRKLAGIEAYAPTDNVSELTARINDQGWSSSYRKWLEGSRISFNDALLVLSVGGGSETTSPNLVEATGLAASKRAKIVAIVSRDGGYAKSRAHACVLVPVMNNDRITPHAEGWQGVVLHLIVNAIADEIANESKKRLL